jgi:nucleolar protein 56
MDLQKLRTKAIEVVKEKLRHSVKADLLIVQAISNTEELDKSINLLSERLREWYELYNPEFSKAIESHERFVNEILSGKDLKVNDSMGSALSQKDMDAILELARQIKGLFALKNKETDYVESLMDKECPNVKAITGVSIGAKLISLAGSLERLSQFPASTIQLLGAEKALFRHLRNKRNLPPKFGILHEHPLLGKVSSKNKGKMARTLADKISIAAKVDIFKGKFVGDMLLQQVEKKAQELKR